MFKGHMAGGTEEGTGSAINIQCGFQPDWVKIWNIDDAGSLDPYLEWNTNMADAAGFKHLLIADDGSTSNKSHEYVTSNGITPYAGTEGANSAGFTIGADTDLNASGETIVWEAGTYNN